MVSKFSLQKFYGSDEDIRFWTGFPSHSSLLYFIDHFVLPNAMKIKYWSTHYRVDEEDGLHDRDRCGPRRSLRPEEELFLTLIKLRRGSANEDLAERFNISSSHVSRIFITWVNFLYRLLTTIDIWMSHKKVKRMLPQSFKGLYDDVIVVLDCTEMECERPSDLELQAATYSSYKSRNTVKGLVGISPNGIPTFVSDAMEGSVSDNDITVKSGLLEKLPKGCAIMADRGWTNKDALARQGVRLVTPSFLMGKKQFDLPSLVESVAIARVRIHVERCMGRIKQWKILKHTLPLTEWRIINHI
ncbi:uncharacterized protein LOC114575052 [Exaiptasia diaphana]|uniref:Transposase n=1 Tax=Exaiptasia diaphana TaxID=2652724 RepID=A0A913YII6_EXADI|nr:uncharacterized protein LOC114575052 [Exaiptasia diaphana]